MTRRSRLVLGLIGITLVGLVVVLALTFKKTVQPIPGGPPIVQLPDLVVDSIDYVGSKAPASSCTGINTQEFDVTVKIKNAGFTAAKMPTWGNWLLVWSVIGGTAPPFKALVSGSPTELASGQTATLKAKVQGMAKVNTPEPPKSALTFAVIVDPDKVVPESNEDNNFKNRETVYGSELCPPPK